MFTRSLGPAALVAASLALATSGTAHAQPLTGLWIEAVTEVQAQMAAHLVRKFGLSPGDLNFRFDITPAQDRAVIHSQGANTYNGLPASLDASIWFDPSDPTGATMSILISGSVGSATLNGSGHLLVTSLNAQGGSLHSDMAISPGGGPGGGAIGQGGNGGPGSDDDGGSRWNDYHSSVEWWYNDMFQKMVSTTTTTYTLDNVQVGQPVPSNDEWWEIPSGWDWHNHCPVMKVGGVAASIDTAGTLDPSATLGFFTVTFGDPRCPADFNADGAVDFFDYDDFVAAFESGDPSGDFNLDGSVDFFDYDDFVRAFETPC